MTIFFTNLDYCHFQSLQSQMTESTKDNQPPEEIRKSNISIQILILASMALLIRSPPTLSSAFVILKWLYWAGLGCLHVIQKRDGWSLFMGKCISKTVLPLGFNWMLQMIQISSGQTKHVFDWKDYELLCQKGLSNLESLDQIFGWGMLISFGIANQTRFEYLMLGIVLVILDTQTFVSLPFIRKMEHKGASICSHSLKHRVGRAVGIIFVRWTIRACLHFPRLEDRLYFNHVVSNAHLDKTRGVRREYTSVKRWYVEGEFSQLI